MNNNNNEKDFVKKIENAYKTSSDDVEKIIIFGAISIGLLLAGVVLILKNPIMTLLCFSLATVPIFEVIKRKIHLDYKMNENNNNNNNENNELLIKMKKIKYYGLIVSGISFLILLIIKIIK